MSEYIYCVSNPAIPGVIMIDTAIVDPRERQAAMGSRGQSHRIDWVVRVADAEASKLAMDKALAPYHDPSWPGQFRCDPMRARAVAIKFTTVRTPEETEETAPPALPALVLGLGLSVQFLGMMQGETGPSVALITAALFWAVYTMPMGSGGRLNRA